MVCAGIKKPPQLGRFKANILIVVKV